MSRTYSSSPRAIRANELVGALQTRFVQKLETLSESCGHPQNFTEAQWLRDGGRYGGGSRLVAAEGGIFNRGSVNVSQVHYEQNPNKNLDSATAISTIIHPAMPCASSVHIHISWTEMKDGRGYWRIMADLNPSIVSEEDKAYYQSELSAAAGELYDEGSVQGDRYFYIPALGRHRGVTHFYLESYNSGDDEADYLLAKKIGETAIDAYVTLLERALKNASTPTEEERKTQLDYHTLYFFQVLTLDRGTTSGLLVHNENDVGIMGSLPSHINKVLLASWLDNMQAPQEHLLKALLAALPDTDVVEVNTETKQKLAEAVRQHYIKYPGALQLQASGHVVPPTVENHR